MAKTVKDITDALGGPTRVAIKMKCSTQYVNKWRSDNVIPEVQCYKMAKQYGSLVNLKELLAFGGYEL